MKAIVLAAGKGSRLASEQADVPKVLRQVCGKPLIRHVLDNIGFIPSGDTIIVVGYKKELVQNELGDSYIFTVQEKQKGTGHAVSCAWPALEGYTGDVLVLYGDMPLFRQKTYQNLIDVHRQSGADCTLLTAVTKEPLAYGRVIRKNGEIIDIIEEKDCDEQQMAVDELNVGVYVFKSPILFENLKKLKNNNAQGEYYLTDIPKIIMESGRKIASCVLQGSGEILGVNTPEDLSVCELLLKQKM